MATIQRKLVFSGWQGTKQDVEFDRISAAEELAALGQDDAVLPHDGLLTTVRVLDVGSRTTPTHLQLLALHDEEGRPNAWEYGADATTIDMREGQYTAFVSNVLIWDNNVAAQDTFADAPGFGRLANMLYHRTTHGAFFRQLYDPDREERLDDLEGWRGVEFSVNDPKKRNRLAQAGFLARFLDPKIPSIKVTLGMGRRGARDAYIDEEAIEDFLVIADKADQFFDTLKIRGKSKTLRTASGNPRLIEVNLLTHRLQCTVDVPRDQQAINLPQPDAIRRELMHAHAGFVADGKIKRALEARLKLFGS